MLKALIIINFIVAFLGLGAVLYSHNFIKPDPVDQTAEEKKMGQITHVKPVPIKSFVVNLHSSNSRLRYLDLELNVLTFTEEQKAVVRANEHLFKDVVIEIAAKLEADDLDSVTGKLLLENRIKKAVNQKLGQQVVKQIYFSRYVVQ